MTRALTVHCCPPLAPSRRRDRLCLGWVWAEPDWTAGAFGGRSTPSEEEEDAGPGRPAGWAGDGGRRSGAAGWAVRGLGHGGGGCRGGESAPGAGGNQSSLSSVVAPGAAEAACAVQLQHMARRASAASSAAARARRGTCAGSEGRSARGRGPRRATNTMIIRMHACRHGSADDFTCGPADEGLMLTTASGLSIRGSSSLDARGS